jgi:hypothetical protein
MQRAQVSLARTQPLSSPRRRGRITTRVSVIAGPPTSRCLRRMVPAFAGTTAESHWPSAFRPRGTRVGLGPINFGRGQANGARGALRSRRRLGWTILENRSPQLDQLGRLAQPPVEQSFSIIVLPASALMQIFKVEAPLFSEIAPFLGGLVESPQGFPVMHEGARNRRCRLPLMLSLGRD